jgi:hypothetical protein
MAPAHEALDGEDRVLGIGDRLAFRHLADQSFTALGERHDRRREPAAFGVGDDDRLAPFHDGDNGIGRAQVDTNDFAHVSHVLFERLGATSFVAHIGDGCIAVIIKSECNTVKAATAPAGV